jgi:parallel beta-helix repeat protein
MKTLRRRLPLIGFVGVVLVIAAVALAGSFSLRIHRLPDGTVQLDWDSQAGVPYEVDWAPTITTNHTPWQVLGVITATNTVSTIIDAGDVNRPTPLASVFRAYRVRQVQPTFVSSDIFVNTTWGLSGSPFIVTNNIHVQAGATLTVAAGVQVLFSNVSLTITGALRVLGNPSSPVVFTSARPVPLPGDWQGLIFASGTPPLPSALSNAVVQYAVQGINCGGSSPQIVSNLIQYCSQYGIYLNSSSPLILGNIIQYNNSDGIFCTVYSSPSIVGNQIGANGGNGITAYGTGGVDQNPHPVINGNSLVGNRNYAVYAYNFYQPTNIRVLDVRSNWWGTADPRLIRSVIYDYTTYPATAPVVNYGNWLSSPTGPAVGGVFVSGPVATNTVWRASDSPIGVLGNVVVNTNVTLTVQPGVDVEFLGSYIMQVYGILGAAGTSNNPIVFTSGDEFPLAGDWQGLYFIGTNGPAPSVVSNAVVEFAIQGINANGAWLSIASSTIQYNSQYGIYLSGSSPLIQGNTIQNNSSDGIYCTYFSSPLILGNQIGANGGNGITAYGSSSVDQNPHPVMNGNSLVGNRNYAVSVNNYYQPTNVVVLNARSNWWGTADARAIRALVYDYSANPTYAPVLDFGNWLSSQNGPPTPGTSAAGLLLANTTWQLSQSPITVIGNLVVGTNATLTIQPGVQVVFYGNYQFVVYGSLQVAGNPANQVRFTSGRPFPLAGDWQGLSFVGTNGPSTSILSNAVVAYAQQGITCTSAKLAALVGSTIQYCSSYGLYLVNSSPLVQGNTIEYNNNDGIYCTTFSSPQVLGNMILGNSGNGITAYGYYYSDQNPHPLVNGNSILANRNWGFYGYNYYQPTNVVFLDARSNWWGSTDPRVIRSSVYDYTQNPSGSPVFNFGNWLTAQGGSAVPGNFVSGPIGTNTVWQASSSPFNVIGNLAVNTNVTLTVQAGVTLQFLGFYQLQTYGALALLGGPTNPVNLVSGLPAPAPNDWQGLSFTGSNGPAISVVSNAVVAYGQSGISCSGASPQVINTLIQSNNQYGVYLTSASPLLQGNTMQFNAYDGIYCGPYSSPSILGNQILSNNANGLECVGYYYSDQNPHPVLHGNSLFGNRNWAVYAYNYYQPTNVVMVEARSNWWGTVDPVLIRANIYDYNQNPSTSPVFNYGNWLLSATGPAVGGTPVEGPLTGNVVWHTSDSPIVVLGKVLVTSNASLTIQPGVQVLVDGANTVQVDGAIQALGQPAGRVVFTSGRLIPHKSDWTGLVFTPASTNASCLLSNVVIEYADIALNCSGTSPQVTSSQLRRNRVGIYLDTSSPVVRSNLIELNDTGMTCYQLSSPTFVGNTVTFNNYNGVEVTSSTSAQNKNPNPLLLGNSILTNSLASPGSYYNLYTAGFYQPASTTIAAVSNWWGTTDSNQIARTIYWYSNTTASPLVSFIPPLGSNVNFTPFDGTNSITWFSPNGNSAATTVTIQGFLSQTSTWAIVVQNASGTVVRSLNGSGNSVLSVWNGTDQSASPLPDGVYRPILVATNQLNGQVAVAYGDSCVLDSTLPTGTASVNTLPDGKVANQLVIQGTANDANYQGYTLEYGAGASPASFTLLLTNAGPVNAGLLGQLNTLTLTNGLYTFRLRVYDLAGNVSTILLAVTIDNIQLTTPTQSPMFFDPAQGTTQVSFNEDRTTTVTAQVLQVIAISDLIGNLTVTLSQNVLKTFQFTGSAGLNSFTWDGTDNSGNPATNGVYYFTVSLLGAYGRTNGFNPAYVAGPVTITNVVLGTNSFNFMGNNPLSISYSLYAPAFMGIGVVPYTTVLNNAPRDQGAHTEYFNGRDPVTHLLVYSNFQVNAKAQVLPENALVVNHVVPALVTNLQTESYLIRPSLSQVSQIYYSLSRPATVGIQLRDPNGNFITVQNQSLISAGNYVLEWDGLFDAVSTVSSLGDYEVVLLAQDAASPYVEIKSANISVR